MARVQIYTTRYCGYCSAAKALLGRRGIEYEELDVTGSDTARQWLVEVTNERTVPQIFVDGVPIGGYRELSALDRSGQLERRLAELPPQPKAKEQSA